MKRLIFAIIVVILAIALCLGGFFYINYSNEQTAILKQELEQVAQVDITSDDIDMDIKTKRSYAVVEETIKNYLSDARNLYVKITDYYSTDAISEILSAENITQDEEELSVVKAKLEEYKNNLNKDVEDFEDMLQEENIMSAIEEKNLRNYYVDIYKSVMLNEVIQDNLQYAKERLTLSIGKSQDKLDGIDKVVDFLLENKSYWEIKNDKIQFTNVRKLTEYYQLLNDAI